MTKKTKKMVVLAMVGALVASSMAVPTEAATTSYDSAGYAWGDVNRDGRVDSEDAYDVLMYYTEDMSGLAPTINISVSGADVTDDGFIDITDAMEILRSYVSNIVAEIPYFMPIEIPIPIGTSLEYSGTTAWFCYSQPKTCESAGTIVPGDKLKLAEYLGNEWYLVEFNEYTYSYMYVPEDELGKSFTVLFNPNQMTETTTTTTTESTTTITTSTTAKPTTTTTTSTTAKPTTTTTTLTTAKPTTTTTTSTTAKPTTTTTTSTTAKPTTTTTTSTTTTTVTTTTTSVTTTIPTTSKTQMFESGQQLVVTQDFFVLCDDGGVATKWALQDDVLLVCDLIAQNENEEEYLVKILSYHANLYGWNPDTPLHMVVPSTKKNCLKLLESATEEVEPFQVHDVVYFTGQAWNLLDKNQEKIGRFLVNSDCFSIEEVLFHGEDEGFLYYIKVKRDLDKFEPAYIYIKTADQNKYFCRAAE